MVLPKNDSATDKTTTAYQNNWYAKLHPIGTAKQRAKPKRLLNLSIFFRVWLAVTLVFIVCGIVIFTQLFGYVKPTAQQVIEDTLLDTSQILAVLLQVPLQSGALLEDDFQQQLDRAFMAAPITNKMTDIAAHGQIIDTNNIDSRISELSKKAQSQKMTSSRFRIYVTNKDGIVVYDSLPPTSNAKGEDYSRWNDVYLTLQGQYGARSSAEDSNQRHSSIMYVAQPIKDNAGQVIGVVSIGKPIDSVLPYLEDTRRRMLLTVLLISMVALILAGLIAWWLQQSISLVTRYTGALAEDTKKPYFYLGHELNSLTDSIESMKHRLENRAYVSEYVHTLTHELKSPLTAIRASSELLEDDGLDDEDKQMLKQSISEQSLKIEQLIDRLLLLAKVEQPTFKLNRQTLPLLPLLTHLVKNSAPKLQQCHLADIVITLSGEALTAANIDNMQTEFTQITTVYADEFWLRQALQNVLDNAIHFAKSQVHMTICSENQEVTITIFNDGKWIPDYALDKIFDRYFSLSHHSPSLTFIPKKGTGLGLTLVKQVIEHHGGSVSLHNITDTLGYPEHTGVQVSITLPIADKAAVAC